jgi:tRNA1(Val) A37 N6-methylase TrmN6
MNIVYPAERIAQILASMKRHKLQPLKIRFIHNRKTTDAKRMIISAIKNGFPNCKIKAPFYIYNSKNEFTKEYSSMLKP